MYDLAGFAVGVVEREAILDGGAVRPGDRLVAMASSGLHANGYSLVRRVLLEQEGLRLDQQVEGLGCPLVEVLLEPTRIYTRAVAALRASLGEALHALCHITGGGLVDNLPRVLPAGLGAHLDLSTYARPAIFELLARRGPIEEAEMRRTFNLGVGMVAVVAASAAEQALAVLGEAGERAWLLGSVVEASSRSVHFG